MEYVVHEETMTKLKKAVYLSLPDVKADLQSHGFLEEIFETKRQYLSYLPGPPTYRSSSTTGNGCFVVADQNCHADD